MTLVTPGGTLTSLDPPEKDVKGFGAWLLVALAGLLGGAAIVVAAAGFAHPSLLPAAVLAGAASYGLWSYGRDRMAAAIHERVEAGVGPDDADADESRDCAAEDWHYRGFDYDWEYDPDFDFHSDFESGDRGDRDPEAEEWVWDDPFWVEGDDPDPRTDGTRGSTAGGSRGRRATADGGAGTDAGTDGAGTRERTGGGDDDRAGTADERASGTATDRTGDAPSAAAAREILGVDADADDEEIRRAYRRRVKETHPDLGGSEAAFRRVRRAYERLTEE